MDPSIAVESEFSRRKIIGSVGLAAVIIACGTNLSVGAMQAIEEDHGGTATFLRYVIPIPSGVGGAAVLGSAAETNKELAISGGIGAVLGAGLAYGSHVAGYYGCKAAKYGKDAVMDQFIEYAHYFS